MDIELQNIEVVRLEEPLTDQLDLIASRMRATLIEVLGPEVGVALHSLDWLKDCATSHIDGRQPGGDLRCQNGA